jgi:hypothetical protein
MAGTQVERLNHRGGMTGVCPGIRLAAHLASLACAGSGSGAAPSGSWYTTCDTLCSGSLLPPGGLLP